MKQKLIKPHIENWISYNVLKQINIQIVRFNILLELSSKSHDTKVPLPRQVDMRISNKNDFEKEAS